MHTETADRQAFELVAEAMERLEDYNHDRRREFLTRAELALADALARDPQYLSASFYAGVVKDLIGKPVEAVPFFDKILKYLPADSEGRRDEIQYSRGVAWYHQYSHARLEQAEHDFLAVANRTKDPSLKSLAHAGLAQTHAMWMIPNSKQKTRLLAGEGKDVLDFISEKRKKCLQQIEYVRSAKVHVRSEGPPSPLSNSIKGTVLNALGMCTMYWTDYNVEKNDEKRQLLDEAIQHLSDADRYLTNDWANTCDIASAHFRLGVVDRASHSKPDGEFQKAVDLLQRVINELRPDYGFAHYELGRIYRVWERFDDAVASFKESLLIPVQYRDVGDATVNNELIRAQKHDSTFP